MDQALSDLQDDVKVLKNEIKETLIGIRDYLLTNVENPFPTELRRDPLSQTPTVAMRPQQMTDASPAEEAPYQQTHQAQQVQHQQVERQQIQEQHVHYMNTLPTAETPQPQSAPPVGSVGQAQQQQPPQAPQTGQRSPLMDAVHPQQQKAPYMETVQQSMAQQPMSQQPLAQQSAASQQPVAEPFSTQQPAVPQQQPAGRDGADLLTVATLAGWVEEGLAAVGRDRLQALVDIYATMGGLSPRLQEVLGRLIQLDDATEPGGAVTVRDCIRVLIDLDSLIWRSRSDNAGLALLTALLGRGGAGLRGNGKLQGNGTSHGSLAASLLAL
jgi:hypothetical protein